MSLTTMKMNHLPSDAIQFLIRIIIASIVSISLAHCSEVDNSTNNIEATTQVIESVHPANSDYNIYKLSEALPSTDQDYNETISGVAEVLHKLLDLESLYNVNKNSGENDLSIFNYMHNFINNLMRNNSTTDIFLKRTERVTDTKKLKRIISNAIKMEKKRDLISSHAFGNKRDRTIMKIPRHARIPEIEAVTKKEITKKSMEGDTLVEEGRTEEYKKVKGKKTEEYETVGEETTKQEKTGEEKAAEDEKTEEYFSTEEETTEYYSAEEEKAEEKTKEEKTIEEGKTKEEKTVEEEKTKEEKTVEEEKTKEENIVEEEKTEEYKTVEEEKTEEFKTVEGGKTKEEKTVEEGKTEEYNSTVEGETKEEYETVKEGEKTQEENTSGKDNEIGEGTTKIPPKYDEGTHMIDWNHWNDSAIQSEIFTSDSKDVKINDTYKVNQHSDVLSSENDDSLKEKASLTQEENIEDVPIKIDVLKYNMSPNHNELEGDIARMDVRWLPEIFTKIFSDFKMTVKDNHSLCNAEWSFYQSQLKNLSLWAVKMYESSDTVPRGFIVGNGYQLGNFDECVSVKQAPRDISVKQGPRGISGKYCLIETRLNFGRTGPPTPGHSDSVWDIFEEAEDTDLRFPKDKLYLSMCIPSGCQSSDLEHSLRLALDQQSGRLNQSISFQVQEKFCCAENQQPSHSQSFIVICGVFTIISLLVISASAYHLITYACDIDMSSPTFPMKLVLSFSAVQNLHKLFAKSGGEMKFFHGLKVISMCLVIMGHRLFYYFQSAILDGENVFQKFTELDLILVHFNIVDTFFTIGGFLTYETLHAKVKQHGLKLIPGAILYRWLRLVPVYASVISFVAVILPSIGNGPIYQLKTSREISRCEENWWTNLLFVSNYVNTAESCLIQSWYLSCDFHLFLMGLLILYVISRNESAGMNLLYSCFAVSIIIPFVVTWRGGYYGIMRLTNSMITDPVHSDYFTAVYSKTHNRASCYLLGMMTSHLCVKLKEKKVKFTVRDIVLLSIVTYCFMELTQFYQWLFYVPGRPYYPLENAIYAPVHRVLWSAGICAIAVVSITTGYGVISPILNHSMYVPLSRLTYCVFLIHTNVQLISIAAARVPDYLTYKTLSLTVGGDIMVSYVLASVLYLLVEAPVANLVDVFLKKDKSMDQ